MTVKMFVVDGRAVSFEALKAHQRTCQIIVDDHVSYSPGETVWIDGKSWHVAATEPAQPSARNRHERRRNASKRYP